MNEKDTQIQENTASPKQNEPKQAHTKMHYIKRARRESLKKHLKLTFREKNIDLLPHLYMHSLVDSCVCPDQGANLQAWHIGMRL